LRNYLVRDHFQELSYLLSCQGLRLSGENLIT